MDADRFAVELPWDFTDVVFRAAWEYPASDHRREASFLGAVLGMDQVALDDDYALLAGPGGAFHLAVRRSDTVQDLSTQRFTLMTRDIAGMRAALESRTPVDEFAGSPVQRVLRIHTPAGLSIDIWEMPEPDFP